MTQNDTKWTNYNPNNPFYGDGNKKTAIFYAFLKCQGGGERLTFLFRDFFRGDFWVGGIDPNLYGPSLKNSFSRHLYNGIGRVFSLHLESKIPIWYAVKRQLYFLFSPKINDLAKYDSVVLSGNVSWIAKRIRKIAKKNNHKINIVAFVHTPPRFLTDQKYRLLDRLPKFLQKTGDNLLKFTLEKTYTSELKLCDSVLTNSKNIQKRLLDYTEIRSDWIFVPTDLDRFQFKTVGDYFISYSRLEDIKRIKLVVEAFQNLPDKKLIICSSGPLKNWVIENIKDYPNISYRGMVSDIELADLVGNCLAGITIPENEDAGITQLEIMAAGKPVIGAGEGGLLDTVIEGETGFLTPPNPTLDQLIETINKISPEIALQMRFDCRKQAENFSIPSFFKKWVDITR